MDAPPGYSIGMVFAPDGEVQVREEDLRQRDVVFSARVNRRYQDVIEERVLFLEEKRGNVESWDKDSLDQEAYNAIIELKEVGGRLLKPESGPGNSHITGYTVMSDEDAQHRAKNAIKNRGIYRLQQEKKRQASLGQNRSGDSDEDSVFSEETVTHVTPNSNDFVLSLNDPRYKALLFNSFRRFKNFSGTVASFSRTILNEIKENGMLGHGGRLLKCDRHSKKYQVVNGKEAEEKIKGDIGRRDKTSHLWDHKRGSDTVEAPIAGRKKRKTKSPAEQRSKTVSSSGSGKAKGGKSSVGRVNNSTTGTAATNQANRGAGASPEVVDLQQKVALYYAIKAKLNESTDQNARKFYLALKRHVGDPRKDLTPADLERIQRYISEFEMLMVRLDDESNDLDDIRFAQEAIDMHMESLPLAN